MPSKKHTYMTQAGDESGGVGGPEIVAPDTAPAAQAPAEAPAPAEPPALIDPPAPAPVVPVTYDKTGDPGLDLALSFIGARGMDAEHPAVVAASNGDFGPMREAMIAMGDKAAGYEDILAVAEQAYAGVSAKAAESAKAAAEAVHSAVGGKEQWDAIAKWAGANADPAEKEAVNDALKRGGLVAKAMAGWLAAQYAKAPGVTVDPQKAVAKEGATSKAGTATALSAQAYAAAVYTLGQKVGYGKVDGHPEYAALKARRAAGQRAGL